MSIEDSRIPPREDTFIESPRMPAETKRFIMREGEAG